MNKKILKSKTFWAGVSGIITAAAGYFTGTVELGASIQMVLTSLVAIFIRSGMIDG